MHPTSWSTRLLLITGLLLVSLTSGIPATDGSYDLVVIGGTPAGVAAAIEAGRLGFSVALVEETPVLGGLLSNGVQRMDDALVEGNSGLIDDFRKRVQRFYLNSHPDDPVVSKHKNTLPLSGTGLWGRWNVAEGRAWEPKVAARIYREMVAEVSTIRIFFRQVPVEAITNGKRIRGVVTEDSSGQKHRYLAKVVIDATYEGDVAAFAGAAFRIGREPRSREEPHAGEIYTDAFCEGAMALPGTIFPGSSGRGDERIQAYCYRFVVKDYGKSEGPHRLKSPPPSYDPQLYKWDASRSRANLPNGKSDMLGINWGGDWAGPNYRWPLASWKERGTIDAEYRNHALGWLYYIQNHGSPNLGLASDEFTDNGNFPYKLYVREARRIEGTYLLTESDIHKDFRGNGVRGPLQKDSVAIGLYEMDSHNVSNPTDQNSPCSGEGAINLQDVTGPFQVPYGVIVPRDIDGLLVPVAVSATHVAFQSIRMEPVWSALGQAAGAAAALALRSAREVRHVEVTKLQHHLLDRQCVLFFYRDLDRESASFASVQTMSLLGAIDGDENYDFRPNDPISMGDFARLVVKGLELPLSITAAHFQDVPRSHPAFRYIETLYDMSTQSSKPFLKYEIRGYSTYRYRTGKMNPLVFANPEHPLRRRDLARILAGIFCFTQEISPPRVSSNFRDVLADDVDAKSIQLLASSGVLSLYENRFEPEAIVDRAEACRVMGDFRGRLRRASE